MICDFLQNLIRPIFEESMNQEDVNGMPYGHSGIEAEMTRMKF
jgi:hypothetical protein